MCGIAGFSGAGGRRDIERMTRRLAHRGPDGEGFHVDEDVPIFLGHRRLAIVDVSTGQQPMWSPDGQIGVIFNGEIYNHAELRDELIRKGHHFKTHHSDTEVLVHGYREWGQGLPEKLNGMFAFAVYDVAGKKLFLARDRFGEKPLYYAHRQGFFAFASELTALAGHSAISATLNVRSLQKYFAYGYLPAPNAMIEGTAKLPGGHWMSYDIASGKLQVQAYWQFRLQPDEAIRDADEPRLIDECEALLSQAAQRRLMSDVPLGLFLSGGLDSGMIAALLARVMPAGALKTFNIGFEEPSFDESAYARIVAESLGTTHFERVLSIDTARDMLEPVLSKLDEPLGDASLLPTYMVSAFARENITVALSGDGGDELFAGYDPFLALGPAETYSRMMPRWLHGGTRKLVDLLPISHANMSLDFKLRRTLMGLSYPEELWLPVWMGHLSPDAAADFFEQPLRVEEVFEEAIALWERDPQKTPVDKSLEFFTQFYLQDDILMKSDRAAMMNSLETRAVFLDNDLADFCARLPARFKFRNGQRKYLLKKLAARLLPDSIVSRKKKGFGIPLAKWLHDVPATLPSRPVAGARLDYAQAALRDHRMGRRDNRFFLWSWLSVQHFAEQLDQTA